MRTIQIRNPNAPASQRQKDRMKELKIRFPKTTTMGEASERIRNALSRPSLANRPRAPRPATPAQITRVVVRSGGRVVPVTREDVARFWAGIYARSRRQAT